MQQDVEKSKQYYFLTFPKLPHKSVDHEVMCRMVATAEKKVMPFLVLVGDQPVYAFMVQLKNENPTRSKILCHFLDPFTLSAHSCLPFINSLMVLACLTYWSPHKLLLKVQYIRHHVENNTTVTSDVSA